MNDGLIPRRYAKAFLKYAQEKRQAESVYNLMQTLSGSFRDNAGLCGVMNNPFIPSGAKAELLVTASGAVSSDTCFADFVRILAENKRMGMARDISLAYQTLYREANNIYRVEITSAAPMEKPEMDRLAALIESHLRGAAVEYQVSVDPDLIGGFVVNIGSERLDASLRNELKQLRLKLLSK